MNVGAALANSLWLASNLGAARSFQRALTRPREVQERWLRLQLARHTTSEFGRTHEFAALHDVAGFRRSVPLADYSAVQPHVERIRRGERDVLACGRVSHLAPTSGTSGARKLIPFTASLQEGFSSAVGAWMNDLVRQRPALLGGPAYWSVSPLADEDRESEPDSRNAVPSAAIPVGFADDADYLGDAFAWLVRRAMAAPPSLRHVHDMSEFWALTLLALLRHRDLRLISVWHPSFIDLLVGAAEPHWPRLVDALATGTCPWMHALPADSRGTWRTARDPARAAELQRLGPGAGALWWPRLQVVSCWGEQAAEAGWARLRRHLPGVLVQAKGLLATEAVVTIPFGTQQPLAVTSHFFEFLDEQGELHQTHEVARGGRYEVVVTNGGGLWRYRLGDVVECTGHMGATPTLRFLGRVGRVSDLRGEKLSEAFVAEVLRGLWLTDETPAYAALRARETAGTASYELLVGGHTATGNEAELGERLDARLRANPHYALARRLGQLEQPQVVVVGAERAREELERHRGRLGDAKPSVLICAAASSS